MASEMLLRCLFTLLPFVPFLLCALAVWRWRGVSRFGAAILLAATGFALATDIYGVIHGGNLAGVLTMAASVPSLLFLAILAIAQSSSKRRKKEKEVDSGAEVVEPEARFSPTRAVLVIVLTGVIAASSIIMVGPQILLIVPVALMAGIVFAVGRSFWSLVCFGYPFTFGLISAWAGYMELPDYERTTAFAVSIGIGLVGCVLIAVGLWKALPGKNEKETSVSNE